MRNFRNSAAALFAAVCLISPQSAAAAEADGGLPESLIPVGETIGISIQAEGVIVVSLAQPEDTPNPAGLLPGDVITAINGITVSNGEEMRAALAEAADANVEVTVRREEETVTLHVETTEFEGRKVLGVWARDAMLGIGTVTWYDPAEDSFGALGHEIRDTETGAELQIENGAVFDAQVTGVVRSEPGTPGQIQAVFVQENPLGHTAVNEESGLFGTGCGSLAMGHGPVPVAREEEIHAGEAAILTDVAGGEARAYTVEITRIYGALAPEGHGLLITVTDPALLELTGGIVQGMSGSPILQDGKLVGAVSHVLVNTPQRGYGVFIENMLETAQSVGGGASTSREKDAS